MIREALRIGANQIDRSKVSYTGENAWREIRIFVNTILQNHPKLYFCPVGAVDLIADIELATTEEGKDKMFKTAGNTEYGMHLTDGFLYLLTTYLNDYMKTFKL